MGEQNVEFGRESDRHRIRAAAGAILGIDMGVQLGDLRLGQLARELAHDEAFELDADVEGIARLLPARRRHHGDPVAAELDQAFGGELTQRMAGNGAADAETFAERIFRQLGAGLQRLLDDGAPERAADHADLVRRFRSLAAGACRHRRIPWE
ncbi:hypothetical protein ABIA06_000552 [Bradyrhizobium yuanmingense]